MAGKTMTLALPWRHGWLVLMFTPAKLQAIVDDLFWASGAEGMDRGPRHCPSGAKRAGPAAAER